MAMVDKWVILKQEVVADFSHEKLWIRVTPADKFTHRAVDIVLLVLYAHGSFPHKKTKQMLILSYTPSHVQEDQ
jgi:hypothetical protein